MEKITINNQMNREDCLIISTAEYEGLRGRIATGLLTFFDRIEFGAYREDQNYELLIRGYRKEWVAINNFFIRDWYVMDPDQFIEAMENKLSFLKENYLKLFPEMV
jgi:hypothetical protein